MTHPFITVVVDMETKKFFVERPDCPGDSPKEISLGAAVQLGRDMARYENDFFNEKHHQ